MKKPVARTARAEKWCVIGPNVGAFQGAAKRHWFDTEAEAVAHAEDLLADRKPGAQPAIVVRAVAVVEVPRPPMTVRAPHDDDFLD